ncbi:MAG: hypothetical protein Q7T08_13590 [Devosia sp.]|nr:hypothetical protein [Devosia sp.]
MRPDFVLRTGLALGLMAAAALGDFASAEARELTEAEHAGLAATVDSFNAAMRSSDVERVIATVPPRVMQAMADKFGMPLDQMRAVAIEQTRQTMAGAAIVSFGMDLPNAAYAETPDGTPYALIPTETVMQFGADKMRAAADTLALIDEGAWYLLRVSDDAQVEFLKQVYPAFAEVELPRGTLEPVN